MLSAQELNECWPDIVSGFPVLTNETVIPQPCDDETFLDIRTMIIEKGLTIIVSANVMHRILNNINFNIKNSFWLHFLNEEIVDLNILRNALEYLTTDISGFEKFRIAIDGFFQLIHSYAPTIKRVQMLHENELDLFKHYYSRIRFLLQSQLPIKYKTIVYHFYRTALRIMHFRAHTHYFNADSTLCPGCYYERTCCSCEITLQGFSTTNWQLCTMGLIELFAEDVVVELISSMIENEVAARTTDNFGIPMLPILFHWISSILFEWIKQIMEEGFCCELHDRRKLDTIMFQLKYCLYNSFTKIRINQLYDMIIRFPYSDPAVNDLSVSLRNTELNVELRELLQYSLKSKLLQHDMSTIDILYVYTSAIKVLRKIDPSGDLVQEVAQLIQGFLQRREKTAPCIISILVSKGPNAFLRSKTILDEEFDSMKSCVHSHCISRDNYHHCDIVALLIDICGSRELFAREYRTLLADRLLVIENINELFKEIKYLKLLQVKLGESLFNSCAMMLKDIDVSRCTNRYFYQEPLQSHCEYNIFNFNLKFAVKGIILSEHYWPRLGDDFIVNLPEIFLNHLEYYKKCYEAYKRNRTIVWNPNLGKVEMDIVINEKCLSVIVSPIQATVIWNFQNQEEWTIDDLSTTMNVPSITLMVFITFWIDKGVLGKKSDDTFILLKNLPRGTPYYVNDDDDLEIIPRGSRLYGDEIL